jgi:methionyl-tRNA formyltransferase
MPHEPTSTGALRLLMLGTGPFALPTFLRLLDSPHEVAALITRPSKPTHARGKSAAEFNPLRAAAEQRGLPIHAPDSINTDAARAEMAHYRPDLLVVCDYGQILSAASLGVARLGGINLHASLLPKYRGAAPIQWAIYHGDAVTGATIIHMTPQLDGGPCLAQYRTPIEPSETAGDLETRLALAGAELVLETLGALASGTAQALPQDQGQASKAPRLKKADGAIDWSRTAVEIERQIRAFHTWPGTFTSWHRSAAEPLRLILDQATVVQRTNIELPGTLVEAGPARLLITTARDALAVERLQPAGKRMLSVPEFLNGYPIKSGERFGEPPTTPAVGNGP